MTPSRKRGTPAALPAFIPPQLATLTDKAPTGDAWIHEIKLDGYRTAGRLDAGKVRMLTRSGLEWTTRFGRSPRRWRPLPIASRLCRRRDRGTGWGRRHGLRRPQDALSRGHAEWLTYHVFDLMHLDGRVTSPPCR